MRMDTWQAIRAERAALVADLEALPEHAWNGASLLPGWTVQDVLAHLINTARMTPPKFLGRIIASGFNFNAMSEKQVRATSDGRKGPELVAEYRGLIDARDAPPGPVTSWLNETIVHGEDMFRALGPYRTHPAEHLVAVADFLKGSNLLIGAKNRIAGVTLAATDTDWRHGSGPTVQGPLVALVMAMAGRPVALDDLSGEGVPVLRGRP
jgi:uncharacterized protein (TIGR03083 family)